MSIAATQENNAIFIYLIFFFTSFQKVALWPKSLTGIRLYEALA